MPGGAVDDARGRLRRARLSEGGRRVGLVEAGPDYGPYDDGRWPADMLDARSLAFSHAWATDGEDRSQLREREVLTSPDPLAPLAIDHGFLTDPHDASVLAEGFDRFRDLIARRRRRRLRGARGVPRAGGARADEHVQANARGFFHPVGKCALGRVVDGDG